MTSLNRSAAVMQQRHEPHNSLDDFPTPKWATRAVCEALRQQGHLLSSQMAWDPCCNRGYMVDPLSEYFGSVFATDVHDYGFGGMNAQADFLMHWGDDNPRAHWIFMNPPFKLGLEFIQQGLKLAERGVAVFVRTAFVEGQERYFNLFKDQPESMFMPFSERVVLWRGVLLDPDVKICRVKSQSQRFHGPYLPRDYEVEKPTTATSYCWLIFEKEHAGAGRIVRIPPSRKDLTRAGDYPPVPDHMNPDLIVAPMLAHFDAKQQGDLPL